MALIADQGEGRLLWNGDISEGTFPPVADSRLLPNGTIEMTVTPPVLVIDNEFHDQITVFLSYDETTQDVLFAAQGTQPMVWRQLHELHPVRFASVISYFHHQVTKDASPPNLGTMIETEGENWATTRYVPNRFAKNGNGALVRNRFIVVPLLGDEPDGTQLEILWAPYRATKAMTLNPIESLKDDPSGTNGSARLRAHLN